MKDEKGAPQDVATALAQWRSILDVCVVSDDEPSRLRDHVIDYVVHLRHHLRQILG